MFEKQIIIDGKGHLLGRLAAFVAKELLNGQRIAIVRAEEIILSGSLSRNQRAYGQWKNIACNTNPWRHGPWHFKAPAKMLWRSIRGMLPHKTPRGVAALSRLRVFEGIPHPYAHQKRICMPNALRIVRLKATRKYCKLGDLSTAVGWNKAPLIEKLEAKRIEKAHDYHTNKVCYWSSNL